MAFNRPIPDTPDSGPPQAKNNGGIQTLMQAEKLTQIAVLLPSAAFLGWLAGAWLDGKLHQTWIGLAGIIFGGISGLVYVVRLVISSGDGGSGDATGTSARSKEGSNRKP